MLYIIENHLNKETLSQLLSSLTKEDCVLLINEGVYLTPWLTQKKSAASFYVLIEHADHRGVSFDKIRGINTTQMVDLTAAHSPCITY